MTPIAKKLDPRGWREALVYGLGRSGRGAAALLRRAGVTVIGVDDALPEENGQNPPGCSELGVAELWRGAQVPASLPAGVDGVVVSPGVPADRPLLADARRRGVPVVAEVELAYHFARGPVVGITGSNGKSTTTALTGALLEAAGRTVTVCGNIGRAFSRAVLEDQLDAGLEGDGQGEGGDGPAGERVWVVELSSFQLEGLWDFRPRAAAWLNLAPDHMDRYPSLDAYAAAKGRLLEALPKDGVAVLNRDDPRVAAALTRGRRRWFSRRGRVADGCYLRGETVVEAGGTADDTDVELFRRSDVPLAGEHNLENAMAAALLARALGVSAEELRQGLHAFRGLPHRMEEIARHGGVVFYDDSKGTNPAATLRSLEGLPDGRVHLILGGTAKGADFGDLRSTVADKARRVYLVGAAADQLERQLAGAVPLSRSDTLEAAVAEAATRAEEGDVVLLSPACASFDQFDDFAHRGREFQRLVRAAVGGDDGSGDGGGGGEPRDHRESDAPITVTVPLEARHGS